MRSKNEVNRDLYNPEGIKRKNLKDVSESRHNCKQHLADAVYNWDDDDDEWNDVSNLERISTRW